MSAPILEIKWLEHGLGLDAPSYESDLAAGMDMRGNLGGDLFTIASPSVLHSSGNTGSGDAAVNVTDLGALSGADYVLEFDGAAYSLVRTDSNTAIPLSGTGTAADPLVADGLSIVTSGAPASA